MLYVQPTQINSWHHTISTTFSLLLEILTTTRDGQVRLQDPYQHLIFEPWHQPTSVVGQDHWWDRWAF